jgi:hypothetical protein
VPIHSMHPYERVAALAGVQESWWSMRAVNRGAGNGTCRLWETGWLEGAAR